MTDPEYRILSVRLARSVLEMLESVAQSTGRSLDDLVNEAIAACITPPVQLDLAQLGQAILDDLQNPPDYSTLSVEITEEMLAGMRAFVLPDDRAWLLLGDELMTKLTGATANRPYTADMQARLTAVATVCQLLRGTRSDAGIRRWWVKRRYVLDGKSPLEFLGAGWMTDTLAFRRVVEMAEADAEFSAT